MKKLTTWLIVFFVVFDTLGIFLLALEINIYSFTEKPRAASFVEEIPLALKIPQKLKLNSQQTLKAGAGVKSVLIDPQNRSLYSFNLEGMSVYEYDLTTQSQTRQLRFEPTAGKGFDYTQRVWYQTYQEKPVEGCFTHNGRYLWISLHNAEGVVVWDRNENRPFTTGMKKAFLSSTSNRKNKTEIGLHFFKTGKTPKVISTSPQNNLVFVANWHDNTVSIIDIEGDDPSQWKVIQTLKTGAVPRGNAVTSEGKAFYLGHMATTTLAKYSLDAKQDLPAKLDTVLTVGLTPRHLIYHYPYLYMSLSSPEKLVKIDTRTDQIVLEARTGDDPRTITLSPDGQLLFVTCYADEALQVFRAHDFKLLGSWASLGKPVGVEVKQVGSVYEAWVCNYTASNLRVFRFVSVN